MKTLAFFMTIMLMHTTSMFGQSTPEICSSLCDKRWRPDYLVAQSGTDKLKHAKDDYLLFNPDQTAIYFEGGHTLTANWIYDDVIKTLTLNFKGIERFEEFVLYTVDKKHLVLIDLKQKKRWHYSH